MRKNGFIEKVWENPSKFQGRPSMWAIRVDGTRYSTGNKKPPAEGAYVEFDAEQQGEYWNATNVSVAVQTTPAPVASTSGYAQVVKVQDVRQDSIVYQSSRKDAIELVKSLLSAGLVDFGKAKAQQKIEVVEILVDYYTTRFIEDCKRLSPPEHSDPAEAEVNPDVRAITRPARAAKEPDPFMDEIPF